MAKNTHIQWCDATFNPWEGCTKVSPGCLNCYAEARNLRFAGGANWGKGAPRRRTSASNWNEPRRWNRAAGQKFGAHNREVASSFGHLSEMMEQPRRPRVFCASLADWLDDEVPIEWLADLLALIHETEYLDWLLLTKRPENFLKRLGLAARCTRERGGDMEMICKWGHKQAPHNVWIGTTVEDQARANERIPLLLSIPAWTRFLSCEPLLERVSLNQAVPSGFLDGLHWVIVGGESGPNARPTDLGNIEHLVWQCRDARIPCFVKQLGVLRKENDSSPVRHSDAGGDPDLWPERFRVRQFPEGGPL